MVNFREVSIPSQSLKKEIKLAKFYGPITDQQRKQLLFTPITPHGIRISSARGVLTAETKKAREERCRYLMVISEEMRQTILEMLRSTITKDTPSGSGHPGGSLSCVEILNTIYFGGILKYDPQEPHWSGRDRFVLSKGHAAPALYAVLAKAYNLSKEELLSLRKLGSRYQGHPEKVLFPEGIIEVSTGSLGQGLSAAVGMAIAAKKIACARAQELIKNRGIKKESREAKEIIAQELERSPRAFCLIGDGEEQEGQIYEAANLAAALRLNNLIAILDWNRLSIDGPTKDVDFSGLSIKNKINKWKALGFQVIFVRNGHDVALLLTAFKKAEKIKNKPTMIIAQTVKGQGVSFMEEAAKKLDPTYHGKVPSPDKINEALEEIKNRITTLGEIDPSLTGIYSLTPPEKDILNPYESLPSPTIDKLPPILPDAVGEQVSTRKAFSRYLLEIAQVDPRIITLCADLGDSVFPGLMKGLGVFSPRNLEGRHLKMGVAEGNMPGVAAGLANFGFLPVIGTFDVFILRMLEQIRNTLSRDKVNAFIVGSHGGVGVGEDGGSHQSVETPGIMKDIPEVLCVEPSDGNETKEILRHFLVDLKAGKIHGPFYFRLTRQEVPILARNYKITSGQGIYILKDEKNPQINLVASGALAAIALEVSKRLEERGIKNRVLTLPIPTWVERIDLSPYFSPFTPILTLQDASTRAMGNILGRNLLRSRNFFPGMLASVGIVRRDLPIFGESGSWQKLYQKYYNFSDIVKKATALIEGQNAWLEKMGI